MAFNFTTIGCLITCARHAIPKALLEEYCTSWNVLTAAWVTEPHKTSDLSHTHLVVMHEAPVTFRTKDIANFFGRQCNVQPLRKLEDVYRSMSYLCKHKMPVIWATSPSHVLRTKEHIMAAFRSYIRCAPKSAKDYLKAQLQRMEEAWEPPPVVPTMNPSQDMSDLVSGSAHQFFPSQ